MDKGELKEALLDDFSDVSDAPPSARAAIARGRRPEQVSDLRQALPPLPDDGQHYVAALVPAYNEEASDIVLTLTDLYCQERELGGRRIVACLVLDGLDRQGSDGARQPILSASTRRFLERVYPGARAAWEPCRETRVVDRDLIHVVAATNGSSDVA